MMDILEIANKCNGDLTTYGGEPLCYTFAIANLEKFAQAVIAAYVAEQKPVGYFRHEIYDGNDEYNQTDPTVHRAIPLYTLEVKL